MRITLSILAIPVLLYSLPSMAQGYRTSEFYEDREIFESGRGGDGICMHIATLIPG